MLEDFETIDMATPIGPDALLLAVMDFQAWPDPNSEERHEQFKGRLDGYCRYVASPRFTADHPTVQRTKLVISIVCVVPPSARMKETGAVYTPGDPSYEILVRFPDEENTAQRRGPKNCVKTVVEILGVTGVRLPAFQAAYQWILKSCRVHAA